MTRERAIKARDLVHARFDLRPEFHEHPIDQKIGQTGHLCGRFPKEVERRGHDKYLVGDLVPPITKRIGYKRDRDARCFGLICK